MRVILQRVSEASVSVAERRIAHISRGLLILLGIGHEDAQEQARFLAEKIANLRVFEDIEGKTNLSIKDVGGEAIVVSQFTLYADVSKGRRPSFTEAAAPSSAEPLVEKFIQLLRDQGVPTQTGAFGQHMQVEIHNDGPVTIWLER
ncbi:MAG TPA: D-aminoacyl-tRNA deacylase [Anaerolineales bacterium]